MSASTLDNQRYMKVAIIGAIIILSSIIAIRFLPDLLEPPEFPGVGKPGTDHQHARFMVWMEGDRISFSPFLYPKYREASEYIMLEIEDGWKMHRFATGATINMFFNSFGMDVSDTCFKIDDPDDTQNVHDEFAFRAEYCNDGDKTLTFYLNDKPVDSIENYVLVENDRILIAYGDYTEEELEKLYKKLWGGRGPGLALG